MSVEFPRSGIVLYPIGSELGHMSLPNRGAGDEEAFQIAMNRVHPDVPPNLARQLGTATNAHFDLVGEHLQLGTAIAVPYLASVVHDINQLRHFEDTGFLRVGDHAKPILAQERNLLRELAENAYGHLQELDLAKDGLFATLRDRRIDIIAPSALGRCVGFATAASEFFTQQGPFFTPDVIPANIWVRDGKGTFVQISGTDAQGASDPAAIAQNHPLHTKRPLEAKGPHTHTVNTTAATGTEYITESVIVPPQSTEQSSERQNGAIIHRATSMVIVTNEISYRLPHDMTRITDEMATNEMEARMASEPDMTDGGMGAFDVYSSDEKLRTRQQDAAGQLDPATSFEWASRIR